MQGYTNMVAVDVLAIKVAGAVINSGVAQPKPNTRRHRLVIFNNRAGGIVKLDGLMRGIVKVKLHLWRKVMRQPRAKAVFTAAVKYQRLNRHAVKTGIAILCCNRVKVIIQRLVPPVRQRRPLTGRPL